MSEQIIAVIPCLLMIALMAFCAGLQVASLAAPISSPRFAVGYGWLIGDLVGLCVGIAFLIYAIKRFR